MVFEFIVEYWVAIFVSIHLEVVHLFKLYEVLLINHTVFFFQVSCIARLNLLEVGLGHFHDVLAQDVIVSVYAISLSIFKAVDVIVVGGDAARVRLLYFEQSRLHVTLR